MRHSDTDSDVDSKLKKKNFIFIPHDYGYEAYHLMTEGMQVIQKYDLLTSLGSDETKKEFLLQAGDELFEISKNLSCCNGVEKNTFPFLLSDYLRVRGQSYHTDRLRHDGILSNAFRLKDISKQIKSLLRGLDPIIEIDPTDFVGAEESAHYIQISAMTIKSGLLIRVPTMLGGSPTQAIILLDRIICESRQGVITSEHKSTKVADPLLHRLMKIEALMVLGKRIHQATIYDLFQEVKELLEKPLSKYENYLGEYIFSLNNNLRKENGLEALDKPDAAIFNRF